MCLHDHRLLCVRACARYTALLPPPTRTHKSYTILFFCNFRYFCKQRTTLFFIVIGSTVKSWPALGVVFEAPLADSHSALYSSIYNLEEQLAASVEKSLRDSYDYNIDENLQYMCLKKHICQYGQLKSKRINSPRRPFAALFRCWDPSSTADVKPSMKVFYFVWGLLHLNLHPNW